MSGMTAPPDPVPPADAVPAPSLPSGSTSSDPAIRPVTAHDGGYRDTVESILIAFILAFVFRAFVVEAFVIPTGSMAPTLLGAHARFTCDDCGYQFEHNFSSGNDDQSIPSAIDKFPTEPDCPNCGQQGRLPTPVPIHYGDRILVLKYAYLLNDPQRWDVVVFKSPDDPDSNDSDGDPAPPNEYGKSWYTTNFIKRLVGKPGDTLMVLDGDIYVSSNGAANLADFQVQSKPRHVQDALWRIVYDNDFLPRPRGKEEESRNDWAQPWELAGGAGWDLGSEDQPRRAFTFNAPQGTGTIRFNAEANDGRAFTDWLAYAQNDSGRHHVSDVKLSFLYDRIGGDGPLRLQLTKLDNTFTAELSSQGAALYHKTGEPAGPDDLGDKVVSTTDAAGPAGGPVTIEFMNVDYGVTLRVGGDVVLTARYQPDVAALKAANHRLPPKPQVRITAANQVCSISHLSLWRDVYYTNATAPGRGTIRWGTPDSPITLKADQYFVMGDNTVISQDARYWTRPIDLPDEDLKAKAGVVPGRFLLGKAFFVYWPAGYRPVPWNKVPGIIPNFGQMRLIH